VCVCVTVLTPW